MIKYLILTSMKGEWSFLFGKDIDIMFIIAQVIGFMAMGFGISAYQMRKRASIIAMQNITNIFWIVQYLLLGAYSAVFVNAIAIVRNAVYSLRGKYKFADSIWIPIISATAFVISGFFTFKTVFDILPIIAMILASFAFFMKDEMHIRYLSIFVAVPWIIFSIYSGSIAGALADSITLVSIIVAIIRYKQAMKPSNKESFGTENSESNGG